MALTQITDLVAMVINELSQVPGVVTQKYSAPIIQQYVQNAYMMEIEEVWWPDHMAYFSVGIDPQTGQITTDLVGGVGSASGFGDIQYVWGPNGGRPLSQLPTNIDPRPLLTATTTNPTNTGMSPLYILPAFEFADRPFKTLPINAGVGPLSVYARTRPSFPFSNSTVIGIDPLLIMYDAAWMYCTNDGTLPAQVAKYELLIRKRRQQMISRFNNQTVPLDSRAPQSSSEWTEQPF